MWELIKANRRRSMVLLVLMAVLMMLLGGILGQCIGLMQPQHNMINTYMETQKSGESFTGYAVKTFGQSLMNNPYWIFGMVIAFIIWLIQAMVAYFAGSDIMLSVSGAREIDSNTHPVLFNVVDEMTIAAGLNKRPRIFIIPTEVPNAFATGTKSDNTAVAVTAGLLGRLNRDELQGVIAHEMSHIANRDVMFMTMVGIMLGTIVLVSEVFLRSLFYSNMGGRYSSNKRDNGGGALLMVIAIVFAIIAPILAQIIYFAISRKREYLADATAVRYTRYPKGLADALEKISAGSGKIEQANKVTAPMYINNPTGTRAAVSLTSTHPPIEKRIMILRKLSGDVGFQGYEQAYQSINHGSCIPGKELHDAEQVQPKNQAAVAAVVTAAAAARSTGDLIMKMNDYKFINCDCGLKLKIPPKFNKTKAKCPKCGTVHEIK